MNHKKEYFIKLPNGSKIFFDKDKKESNIKGISKDNVIFNTLKPVKKIIPINRLNKEE